MAGAMSHRLSREDHRKARELDELRKTAVAPPELDEDGKMINPHIPQYVSQAPWYLNNNHPSLKHQYMKHWGEAKEKDGMDKWYQRGAKGAVATKFRKGACTNCGAMHKVKDCVERPRKRSAKLTRDFAPDDLEQSNLDLTYDGKRDRWNGFDPKTYDAVIARHAKTEAERRKQKKVLLEGKYRKKKEEKEKKRLAKQALKEEKERRKAAGLEVADSEDSSSTDTDTDTDTDKEEEDSSEDDDMKDVGRIIQSRSDTAKFTTNRTTARDLRQREDTAKYLRNLNLKSAYYDPKSRSMRENPHPEKDPSELLYAGDNFVRASGDAMEVNRLRQFVWDAQDKGNEDVHLQTNPSQAELLYAQYREKKEKLKSQRKGEVLGKYGGSEHLQAPPKELLLAQSENYVEYAETGEVVKGEEEVIPKTKYVEGVLEGNHAQIWGSFWHDGKWGYKCCKSCIRNSYCIGETNKEKPKALMPPPPARKKHKDPVPEKPAALPPVEEGKEDSDEKEAGGDESAVLGDTEQRRNERLARKALRAAKREAKAKRRVAREASVRGPGKEAIAEVD